jgi:FMN reductase (NADPH)
MKKLTVVGFFRGLTRILRGTPRIPAAWEENATLRLLFNRRSVRKFRPDDIPPEVVSAILDAGRLAPSTVNLQTWSFGVYDAAGWRDTFGAAIPFGAPRAVMILGDTHRARRALDGLPCKPFVEHTMAALNAGIAAYAMNVAAEACGVASVMLSETGRSGFYDALWLKERLGLPEGVVPLVTIVLGYPAETPLAAPPRLPLDQIVFYGRYRESDSKVLEAWREEMQAGYRAAFVTRSLTDQLNHYLKRVDDAEAGLQQLVTERKEEFRDKV